MATPFSAPDEAIINEVVPLSKLTLASTSKARDVPISELYDTQEVCDKIVKHRFRKIALQFPDELLCDASHVLWDMQARLRSSKQANDSNGTEDRGEGSSSGQSVAHASAPELFLLADTSYGNCCVDEVAAEHVDADLVVHFGHACLSPTTKLPTIYVFHKLPIDEEQCVEALEAAYKDQDAAEKRRPVLMYDVGYEHAVDRIKTRLSEKLGVDIDISIMDKTVNWDRYISEHVKMQTQADGAEEVRLHVGKATPLVRKNLLPRGAGVDEVLVLYIGPESLALTNLLLRLGPNAVVIRYDATTSKTTVETGKTNRLLQRRYVAVQKARDAQTVALLVGTLGMRSYLPLLKDLRKHLIEVQGKRVYTISVGKLNPAKLANFQEIDVFVLIACPENSLIDAAAAGTGDRAATYDHRDFFRPIVTPYELLTAFKGRTWGTEYVLDIEDVHAGISDASKDEAQEDLNDSDDSASSDEEPHFSLVTGGLVSRSAKNDRKREQRLLRAAEQGQNGAMDASAGVVVARNKDGTLARVMDSAGAAHIAGRTWRGLEQRLGMDEAAPLELGRTGVAAGYVAGEDEQHEGGDS